MFLSQRCHTKCQDFSGVYFWITVQWISEVNMRCPITWHSLYYKSTIPRWAKCQCSSMSRWSEPWVDKCYVLWCPPFHMFNHDSQLVHVDEWWEPPGVNMMTEEMWQRWTSTCQLAARLWWSPTTVVYQHHRTEGIVLPGMAHSMTSCDRCGDLWSHTEFALLKLFYLLNSMLWSW